MFRLLVHQNHVAKFGQITLRTQPIKILGLSTTNCRSALIGGGLQRLRHMSLQKSLDVSTNVAKDVLLFKYENPRHFKGITFFAITQFAFWTYLSTYALQDLKDAPVPEDASEDLPFWRRMNLGENRWKNTFSVICFLIGYGILFGAWMFTVRSVRLLILRKGGKTVTFVTYTPFGSNRIMDVPLNCCSAVESRHSAKTTLPIKVKNRSLYYVLDLRGEFKNGALFDQTVGMYRKNVSK